MHVVIVIFIISFLVILHELGHYLAALICGVEVDEFGIGYPPKLVTLFTYKGTQFSLNAIPFGGFVRLAGEYGSQEETNPKDLHRLWSQDKTKKSSSAQPFYLKSIPDRLTITLAGVTLNLLFAVLAFSFVYSFLGIPTQLTGQARVVYIAPDSPAAIAQLPVNVNILKIQTDQTEYIISNPRDVQLAVDANRGKQISLIISGDCQELECSDESQQITVYARTQQETPAGDGAIGVGFTDSVFHHYPWYQMPFYGTWYGIKQSVELGWTILQSLAQMVTRLVRTGSVPQDVAGPVGIVYHAYQGNLISDNFWYNLGFAAMLSLNLSIMNLLPIPALDGGRAVFILLEKVIGKRRLQKIESTVNYGGFVLLLILIITITISDVSQILSK
jgi:regulator of sigma E protease